MPEYECIWLPSLRRRLHKRRNARGDAGLGRRRDGSSEADHAIPTHQGDTRRSRSQQRPVTPPLPACTFQNCDMNEEMRLDCVDLVITATERYQSNYEACRDLSDTGLISSSVPSPTFLTSTVAPHLHHRMRHVW